MGSCSFSQSPYEATPAPGGGVALLDAPMTDTDTIVFFVARSPTLPAEILISLAIAVVVEPIALLELRLPGRRARIRRHPIVAAGFTTDGFSFYTVISSVITGTAPVSDDVFIDLPVAIVVQQIAALCNGALIEFAIPPGLDIHHRGDTCRPTQATASPISDIAVAVPGRTGILARIASSTVMEQSFVHFAIAVVISRVTYFCRGLSQGITRPGGDSTTTLHGAVDAIEITVSTHATDGIVCQRVAEIILLIGQAIAIIVQ